MFKRCYLLFILLLFTASLFSENASAEEAEQIVLPASLKEIQDDSFFGTKNVREVILPDGLEIIGARAFASSSLEKVTFPASVKYIGPGAFDGAPIQSVSAPEGSYAEIWAKKNGFMGYTPASDFTYVIEDGKCTITKYLRYAKEVIVPPIIDDCSVVAIGERAFDYKSDLISITLPDTVTSIGNFAFSNCTRLASIYLSDSLTFIDRMAFYECRKLTSISLPDSLSSVGKSVFRGCGLTNITLPNSITTIEDNAFYECKSLTEISLPDTLVSIEFNAFTGCNSLSSISLPESLVSIGNHAFNGCSSLANIILPNSLTSIGVGALLYCSSLTDITLPDSLSSVGAGLFVGCSSLTSVILPNSLTSIGDSMFSGCGSMKTIMLPDSLTSIGNSAFERSGLTEITLPDSLISIGDGVFRKCISLKSLELPDNLSSFGRYPFEGCSELARITLPNTLTTIKSDLLAYCSGLTGISFPDSVTTIEDNAFYGCYNLISVSLPNTITSIGENVFQGCSGLKSIVIPDSITSIPSGMCYKCSSLTDVFFPDTLKRIGENAFRDCDSLTVVSFPASLTVVDKYAFQSCDSLFSIDFPKSRVAISYNAFSDCSSLTYVTFPDTVGYQTKDIYPYAFQNCISLISVRLPNYLKRIGNYAFENCVSLEALYIPKSVTTISEDAFSGCGHLTLSYESGSYAEKWAKENLRVSNPFCTGYLYTCYPQIAFFNGERPEYTLESSDPSVVAIVDDVSTEAPLGPMMRLMKTGGSARVTARVGETTKTFTVMDGLTLRVSDGRNIVVTDKGYSFSMYNDEKLQLIPELKEQVILCSGASPSFLVPDEDQSILTCDQNGYLRVKNIGTATVYVQVAAENGPAELSIRCDITITENPVKHRAILIGLNDYTVYNSIAPAYGGSELDNQNVAENDLIIMEAVLESVDERYEVEKLINKSRQTISKTFEKYSKITDEDDVTFIYIMSHGCEKETGTGSGSIVLPTVDSDWNGSMSEFYYDMKDLYEALSKIKGTKILLLGSCGSGAALGSEAFGKPSPFISDDFIVITAVGEHKVSHNHNGWPAPGLLLHGNAVSWFAEAFGVAIDFKNDLPMPADTNPNNCEVTVEELVTYMQNYLNSQPILAFGAHDIHYWSTTPESDVLFKRY